MTNDDLKLILDQHFSSIENVVKANGTAIRAKVEAEVYRVEQKVDHILKHNDRQNGWIERNTESIKLLKDSPANKIAEKLQKKWFWYVVAVGIVLVYLVLATIYHTTGFAKIIERVL